MPVYPQLRAKMNIPGGAGTCVVKVSTLPGHRLKAGIAEIHVAQSTTQIPGARNPSCSFIFYNSAGKLWVLLYSSEQGLSAPHTTIFHSKLLRMYSNRKFGAGVGR